jgi:membrane-bound lytic murein transglycosylase F
MQRRPFILVYLFFATIVFMVVRESMQAPGCHQPDPIKLRDLDSIVADDTLHVVMGYNSVNYFVYKGTPMGYQYEMVQQLCTEHGWFLDLHITNDVEKAFQYVAFGDCDLLAMELTVAENRYPRIVFAESLYSMRSLLVQKIDSNGNIPVKTLSDLDGKKIVIPRKTNYRLLLQHLADSMGIVIEIASEAVMGTEDLTNMVAEGEIELTVCDEHLARTVSDYYPELDFSVAVSKPEPVAWAVNSKSIKWLAELNLWLEKFQQKGNLAFLQRKYFDNPILYIFHSPDNHSLSKGKLSPYDRFIKKYSKQIGWDWRLIASLIYQESRFTTGFQSSSGAFGIMQMMPVSAAQFGVYSSSSVEEQIEGGTKMIHYMDTAFAPYMADNAERQKVVIAAYNLGMAHFYDAFELARKMKKEPLTYTVVIECLKCKSKPQYYNDPVVRYGYVNPWYADRFVKEIYERYNAYCAIFPADN